MDWRVAGGGLAGVSIEGEEALSGDFSAIREIRRSNFLCDDVISDVRSKTCDSSARILELWSRRELSPERGKKRLPKKESSSGGLEVVMIEHSCLCKANPKMIER